MSFFTTADGAAIAYDVAGSGPGLLLIHAGIADRSMWEGQLAAFSPTHTVVAFDLRGFGESAPASSPVPPHADALALLDHLGIQQAAVVGVSMGAKIALNIALTAPERITALVLCSSSAAIDEPSDTLRAMWSACDEAEAAGDIERCVEIELAAWVEGVGRPAGTLDPQVRQKARQMIRGTWDRAIADGPPAEPVEANSPQHERFHEVAAPTLIIVGDLDQPDIIASCQRLAESIPNARLEMMSNVAHLPPMEAPEIFNGLLRSWIGQAGGNTPSAEDPSPAADDAGAETSA